MIARASATLRTRAVAATILGLSVWTGCGIGPLVGTWHGSMALDSAVLDLEYTFRSDGLATLIEVNTVSATATTRAGCVRTVRLMDFAWSVGRVDTQDTLTLSPGMHATESMQITNCADPADDVPLQTRPSTMGIAIRYQLADDHLTLMRTDVPITIQLTRVR